MSVAHILNIRNKLISKLAIAENIAVLILTPRTCVYLVNIDRHILVRMLFFVIIPLFIMPLVAVNFVNTGRVVGTSLAMKSIRIGFEPSLMPRGFDTIFIAGKLGNSSINNSQTPPSEILYIKFASLFQSLKSPTTETDNAFGAHTLKTTP